MFVSSRRLALPRWPARERSITSDRTFVPEFRIQVRAENAERTQASRLLVRRGRFGERELFPGIFEVGRRSHWAWISDHLYHRYDQADLSGIVQGSLLYVLD